MDAALLGRLVLLLWKNLRSWCYALWRNVCCLLKMSRAPSLIHCVLMEGCVVCVSFYVCFCISWFVRSFSDAVLQAARKLKSWLTWLTGKILYKYCHQQDQHLVHMGNTFECHFGYSPENDWLPGYFKKVCYQDQLQQRTKLLWWCKIL